MNNEVLKWEGPFKLKHITKEGVFIEDSENVELGKLLDKDFNKSGVYMWTHKIKDIHYIHYIGVTTKRFSERMGEHFRPLKSGEGCIYSFDCCQRITAELDSGKTELFRTENFSKYKRTASDKKPLVEILGEEYIESLNFFFCPIEGLNETGLREIETNLIYQVARDGGVSSSLFFINTSDNDLNQAEKSLSNGLIYKNKFDTDIKVDVFST